jgi:hypothetical protein
MCINLFAAKIRDSLAILAPFFPVDVLRESAGLSGISCVGGRLTIMLPWLL